MHLDHGPCGIPGPTDPVIYEDDFLTSKVEIPRKCATCHFLKVDAIRGFHCTKDASKWGDIHRGLDWGTWEPIQVDLSLPLPKITTRQLQQHLFNADQQEFVREYRRVNHGLSLQEAIADYDQLRSAINRDSTAK